MASAQATEEIDLIGRGQELIQAWENLENQNSRIYHKYLLVLEYVGPIQYQQLNMADLSQMRGEIRMDLSAESRERIHEFIRTYNPRNFSGPDQEVARRVRSIGSQMLVFLNNMDGNTGFQLVQRYESEGYSVRRSLRTRMYHLGPEIMRFAAAIVVVRIATCFGGSPQKIMEHLTTWRTPEMVAKNTDPVCIDELVQMLKSPIFYVGFSAFIAGSAVANSLTLKALQAMDPDRGPRTRAFEKNWLPNIALAVGFMSDHLVKTLVQNQYLGSCGKLAVKQMGGSVYDSVRAAHATPMSRYGPIGASQEIGEVIAHDTVGDETYEVRDFFGGFKDQTCRRAFHSVTSDQFLSEELGVGLVGLVTTAVTMAQGSRALGYINAQLRAGERIRKASNMVSAAARGTALAARLSRYSVVLSVAGGPVGFAIGTARMVVFLGLFEVINPYIEDIYFSGFVKADVDQYTRRFATQVGRFSPNHFPLLSAEECSHHYSGEQENGDLRVCSRLPIVSSLYTFHDYSQTWRKKHILKDFIQSHSRWKQKLGSYINNYMMSFELTKTLVRTREMYLKFLNTLRQGKDLEDMSYEDYISEIDRLEREGLNKKIDSILADIPDQQGREHLRAQVESDFSRHRDNPDYESPYAKAPESDPGRRIFDILDQLEYHAFLLEILPFGTPFKGINGPGHFPNSSELDALVIDVIDFIGHRDDKNYSYVEVLDFNNTLGSQSLQHEDRTELLQELGMPLQFAYHLKQVEIIKWYLSMPDQEFNVIGLMLFQEWAPQMFGPFPRFQADDEAPEGHLSYNPHGLHPNQWPLYQRITTALENFTPTLPWEMWYILATYGELPSRERQDDDGQFHEISHQLQTKTLADFNLSQLLCGQSGSYRNLFGDNGGVALQFQFPHLGGDDVCQNLVHEIHMTGENAPSPFRSVFANQQGLFIGLHQTYIRQPMDSENPLVFNTEQEAGDWWNQNVRPRTLHRLDAMSQELSATIEDTFNSRLSEVEIEPHGWFASLLPSWVNHFFGGQNDHQRQAERTTSTESLTLSLVNEYFHYRLGLQHLLTAEEYRTLEPDLIQTGRCLVDLINSLPEKKYRVVSQGCYETIDNVKFALESRNGKYNSEQAKSDFRALPEADLDQEQRRDRVVIEIWEKISDLLAEIDSYNRMVNESFNFALDEGEVQ